MTIDHGAYVANMCLGCHGAKLNGGKIPGGPPDWPPAANLTPGEGSVMTRYADADTFARLFQVGQPARRHPGEGDALWFPSRDERYGRASAASLPEDAFTDTARLRSERFGRDELKPYDGRHRQTESPMSNELRNKLHELQELSNNAADPQTRAIIEALRLQTAILNERLFRIELQLNEAAKRSDPA